MKPYGCKLQVYSKEVLDTVFFFLQNPLAILARSLFLCSATSAISIQTSRTNLTMDKVLQAGVTSGVSATSALNSGKPRHVSDKHTGRNILPSTLVPEERSRVDFPVANPDNPVRTSWLCIGAWPWGDKATWNWRDEELPEVKAAWRKLFSAGINFIDTAQAYGADHSSEEIVGQLVAEIPRREEVVVQTKYFGAPVSPPDHTHSVDAPIQALQESLARLKMDYVDIYLVHGPVHPQSIKTVAEGMAKCVAEGLARAVGVANYDVHDVQRMRDELARFHVPLATNQCEFSVLRRMPETSGEIRECAEHNMVFQSHSSLAQGRLTGKYTTENPPPSTYRFANYDMKDVEPVLAVLRDLAEKWGKSVAAVALNYNMSKGTLPVVGIRNVKQAEEALEALGWRLSEEDVVRIDKVAFEGNKTRLWQQG